MEDNEKKICPFNNECPSISGLGSGTEDAWTSREAHREGDLAPLQVGVISQDSESNIDLRRFLVDFIRDSCGLGETFTQEEVLLSTTESNSFHSKKSNIIFETAAQNIPCFAAKYPKIEKMLKFVELCSKLIV